MSDSHEAGHGHTPPPLPEPKTPMWLPAVGGALFVLAGAWWVAMPRTADADAAPTQAAADAGAPAAAATR